MSKNRCLYTLTLTFILALNLLSITAFAKTDIYVDATNGDNRIGDASAEKPYKSITFALLISERTNKPDPWHVHVHPGTYDANPEKPAPEREIFPLKLRKEMILEGTTTAEECIIDAQHLIPFTDLMATNDCSRSGDFSRFLERINSPLPVSSISIKNWYNIIARANYPRNRCFRFYCPQSNHPEYDHPDLWQRRWD